MQALHYCMVLPGPEAQQLATYIGGLMHRRWGGIVAGGLFMLPSLLILIGLSWLYFACGQVPAVAGVLHGIKPAVTAIVVSAAGVIGHRGGCLVPAKFAVGGGHGQAGRSAGAAVIDDDTSTPDHARFSWSRFSRWLVMGAGLRAAAMAAMATPVAFLFISLGVPFIESTHGDQKFTAPLTA